MRHLLLVPVVLAALPAQSLISPVHFAAAEAPSSNINPLGATSQELRFLQIHEDLPAGPITVLGMSFRRNASAVAVPAFGIEMAIACSAGGIPTAAAPDSTFDANHARARTAALARQVVNFGATSGLAVLPRPFEYRIMFDVPVQASSRLVWDMRIFNRTNAATISLDACDSSNLTNPPIAVLSIGQGCFATGQSTRLTVGGGAQMNWPNNQVQMSFTATNGAPNLPGVATLGFDSAQMNGLPLPLPLPGSSGGTSGVCHIYNDIVATIFGSFGGGGVFATPSIAIPVGPELHGLAIFHQVLEVDFAANPLGLVSSGGIGRALVAPHSAPAVGMVGSTGSATATTGLANGNRGTIVQFLR
jgi:hypothetical protein